jgi:hypothetical protein
MINLLPNIKININIPGETFLNQITLIAEKSDKFRVTKNTSLGLIYVTPKVYRNPVVFEDKKRKDVGYC